MICVASKVSKYVLQHMVCLCGWTRVQLLCSCDALRVLKDVCAIFVCRNFVAMGLLSKTLSWVRYVTVSLFLVLSVLARQA